MNDLGITHKQAKALAAFVHELRGDWDVPGVMDAIGNARGKGSAAELAIAAIRAASSASNRTPAVLALDGAHWREKVGEPQPKPTFRPPRKDECCPVHAGSWADSCSGCAADQLAGDQTTPPNLRKPDVSEHVTAARAALREARA